MSKKFHRKLELNFDFKAFEGACEDAEFAKNRAEQLASDEGGEAGTGRRRCGE